MSASKQRKESILERKIYKELKLAIDKCERCGCQEDLTIHHLFSWGNYLWRTNLTNLICVCRGCHDWVEQTPAGKQWVQDKYADRIRALLNDKARKSDIDILISIWRDRGIISRTRSNEFLTDN